MALAPCSSVAVSRKVSRSTRSGAVKVGLSAVASLSVTVVPAVCSQRQVIASPSASWLALVRVTVRPETALPYGAVEAAASGGSLGWTVMVAVACADHPARVVGEKEPEGCGAGVAGGGREHQRVQIALRDPLAEGHRRAAERQRAVVRRRGTNITRLRLSPASGSVNAALKSLAANGRGMSSYVSLAIGAAVGTVLR